MTFLAYWHCLMENFLKEPLAEIIFSSSDSKVSQAIRRAVLAKKLRKIAPRIYSSNFKDSPEDIISRNRYLILAKLFPNAVISHRSAIEGGFSQDNLIVLTYKYTKKVKLPGLIIRLVKGISALEGDTPFLESLYIASRPRAFLENLESSRGPLAKTLLNKEIEIRLDKLVRIYGTEELNSIRDQAKVLAPKLKLDKEFKKLDKMIGAIIGTHEDTVLQTDIALSRAHGKPYDPYRIELFATLTTKLNASIFQIQKTNLLSHKSKQNFAFFEAYFSNFIEGTEFEIDEAEKIIFENKIIPNRSDDSHDILGTYKIISNESEMSQLPADPESLIEILKRRHTILMETRSEKTPGKFKEIINKAGNTIFVKPDEVIGTLYKGFEMYQTLEPGIARAIYMMFLITEVHPFLDGNGRIARIMMNAEFSAANQFKILIPTVYREDYLLALRKLSRQKDPNSYIRMLEKAQLFSSAINYENYEHALKLLRECYAFLRADEGKLKFP